MPPGRHRDSIVHGTRKLLNGGWHGSQWQYGADRRRVHRRRDSSRRSRSAGVDVRLAGRQGASWAIAVGAALQPDERNPRTGVAISVVVPSAGSPCRHRGVRPDGMGLRVPGHDPASVLRRREPSCNRVLVPAHLNGGLRSVLQVPVPLSTAPKPEATTQEPESASTTSRTTVRDAPLTVPRGPGGAVCGRTAGRVRSGRGLWAARR